MKSYSREEIVIAANDHIEEQQYWLDKMSDNFSNMILMTKDAVSRTEYGNGVYEFQLSKDDSKRIIEFSRDNDYTIHMTFVAAFTLMIYKYTGLTDILIDTPIYKQNGDGPYINTVLTLKNRFKEEENLKELLLSIRKNISEAVKYQNYPISLLADKLSSDTSKINYPFTDAAIIYENIQDISYLYGNHYGFMLSLLRDQYGIGGKIHYNSSAYTSDEIKTMSMHFCKVLHELLADLSTAIKDVNMMDEAEKRQILYDYNSTKTEYPDSKTLHALFRELAKRHPDAVAAVFAEQSITYGELDRKSEALAYELRGRGVTRDSIVGIIVKRSLEMIIGILGILKAGGAYLPIDPDMPVERLNYIVEDSGMKLAVTQTRYYDSCSMVSEVVDLQDDTIYGKKIETIELINQPSDLAYVIYTSGSTGNPKGAMIEHTSVINRINWMQKKYTLTKDDVILQKTPFTFDVSVWEMFWWMFVGAKVCFLIPEGEKNPAEIIKAIEENSVTVMHFVPSMLNIFLENVKTNREASRITSLKKVFASGEALTINHVKKFNHILNKKNNTKLYNLYGPTEATVDVTYFDCPQEGEIVTIPIGKPIDNIRIYILDKDGRLQPKGIAGEICIAGVGVGRGYLNKPELTKEKFKEDPFVPGARMYKTGDLGRWMEDGNIEYLGRNDFQVKIRGFRIELGEIEKQLLKCEAVKEAVALVKTDKTDEKYICAYIISNGYILSNDLKVELSKVLPEYMIPSFFVQLDKIPLTLNGKINRKELLSIEEKHKQEAEYTAPESELEKQLEAVWCEILDVDRVGVNDDFFDIGGQSLKAVNMVAKVYSKIGININLENVFKYRTIRDLADSLKNVEAGQVNRIEHRERRETYPISAAQKRLYILNRMEDNLAYNITYFLEVEGQFDIDKANASINQLVNRHGSLRTAFEYDGKNIVQKIYDDITIKIEVYEENVKEDANPSIYEEGLKEVVRKHIKPFRLDRAPLCRMLLLKVNQKKCYMLFDIHHIIADGISVEIITREFSAIYNGEELPEVKIQYSDYVLWQHELMETDYIKEKEAYWIDKFSYSEKVPVLSFPLDYPKPAMQSFEGDDYYFALGRELSERIKEITSKTGTTLYMFLLAAYHVLLSKYCGQNDIVIGTPVAGRTHDDLQDIVGMFVNTVPMRNISEQDMTFSDFLGKVKINVIQAFKNQDYQLDMLVEKLTAENKLDTNQLYQVMFILQNYDMNEKNIQDIQVRGSEFSNGVSKADFSLYAKESPEYIECCFVYCTSILKLETVKRMAKHYTAILENICNDIHEKLENITMITETEKRQLLSMYDATKAEYPSSQTIHGLFEEQADKTPDNIAVVYEDGTFGQRQITYRELNEKSNQLARALREKGVAPNNISSNNIVAIMAERSIEMIVGIMGILKAGGAYLPIDPEYPRDRIEYMLQDSGTGILLTQKHLREKVGFGGAIVELDDEGLHTADRSNMDIVSSPNNLAYVIYTSGTTGRAKGAMIEHRNVVRLMFNDKMPFDFNDADVWTMFHSYCFDFSVWEMYGALLYGGKLVVIAKSVAQDSVEFLKILTREKVTVLNQTPSAFSKLLEAEEDHDEKALRLRYVIFGGEALKPVMLRDFYAKYPSAKLINMYGITETTVHVTYKEITKAEIETNISNIGKPIPTLTAYVMDKNMRLMPIGLAGELCVGGDGVCRGYLNRPEMTEEKFVQNHYKPGERLYRSGDLVKMLSNGEMEYLGRIDHQVKIRGHRIELGEVESHLLKHEDVKEAIVMAREDKNGEKYLCAYFASNRELAVSEIREYLGKELPEYMIPSYFMQLDRLPLTSNGKIDSKALPEPYGNIIAGAEYEAPRNKIEEKLVKIWQEVLGIEKIGINDNLFDLGGHSLKATSIMLRINKELNVEVSLKEIFSMPVIKELSEYIKGREENIYEAIVPVEEKEYYDMSSAQKRLYTLHQFDREGTGYNISVAMEIEGKLNVERLGAAFRRLVERHEALRTSCELIGEEIVQKVHKEVEIEIEYKEAREENAEDIVRNFIRSFDLSKAPLLRVGLIKLNTQKHILMCDMHHIISDGISMRILIDEFVKLYEGQELLPLRLQYKDYCAWQAHAWQVHTPQDGMLESGIMKKHEEYWLKAFEGEIPTLNLPTDCQRPPVQSFEGDSIHFELSEELTNGLRRIAKETGATMYMVLLAGFNILLSKYSRQEDIVVGSPIAGRPHADLGKIIGMFVNTLAMRNYPQGSKTVKEFVEEVKTNALRAYENQYYQFDDLVDKLDIRRDMSRNPVFDVMFAMQNMDAGEIAIEGISIKPYDIQSQISKFDITLTALETEHTIELNIEYCTKLFNKETIERIAGHLKNVLRDITQNMGKRISAIELVDQEERQKLLYEFNDTYVKYPKDKTIYELFEEQVDKTPDNVAVVYEDRVFGQEQLIYRELNEKSNQLARMLREKGVVPDSIAAIMVERSLEMVICILGILKAGGAYLPIDPQYPRDRIEYMLEDSRASILFTQKHLRDNIAFSGEIIELDDEQVYIGDSSNLEIVNGSSDLAYVIYTSGSTGRPKGVMVEHKALINFIGTLCDRFDNNFGESDKCLSLTSIAFDVSVGEIFLPITRGCTLVLYSGERMIDISQLYREIASKDITFTYIPPSILKELNKELQSQVGSIKLNKILVGVEPIKDYVLGEYLGINKDMQIVNGYGPTEATICATMYKYTENSNAGKNVPIGRPVNNARIYIVDKDYRLQTVGVAGEICIAGDGLARGYLNKPELTVEKFIPNPIIPGERIYKTGDFAKWLPDGNIEFIGRADHQVKVRGYRIELGEIENCLLSYEYIKEAVVVAKEDENGSKYLCAYIVGEKGLKVSELREYLGKELPDYMIPTYFVQLDRLPLTPNGKIDGKVLPEPDGNIITGAEYEAPRNEIEEKLVSIWQGVLGIEKIGINDNFFHMGGHSLRATSMTARIHKQLNAEVPLRRIFKTPTIRGIAEYILDSKESIYSSIEPVEEKECYEMSSAQKRLYALQQFDINSTNYNMLGVFELQGELDVDKLKSTFRQLVDRHESLRSSFHAVGEGFVQKVHKEVEFEIQEYDEIDEASIKNIVKSFIMPFDLSKAPLLRVGIVRVHTRLNTINKHILMYDMHHIISDGISIGILVKEFSRLYEGEELATLRIQYKDFSEWQNKLFRSDSIKKQEEYWLNKFSGEIPVLNLPTDYQRPVAQSFEGDSTNLIIEKALTEKLREIARETGSTMYMVLLAAYNVLLSKYSAQEDIVVGSPIAGRPHADLGNIIGMFVNTLGMRNQPDGQKTFREFLREVKENALSAYENQDYQFEELVEKLKVKKDFSRNPLFDVMFVLQNMEMNETEVEGLKLSPYKTENKISKFDMTLIAVEEKESVGIRIEYCIKLFSKETIERMAGHLENVIKAITQNMDQRISEIELLDEEEKHRLLHGSNDTYAEYPKDKTIHELFEEQADKTPDNIAAVYEDRILGQRQLTYRELNEKSNQLARVLQENGVVPDSIVGIIADRSLEMVIGILGILKAGGAYLPIDPEYPRNRIEYMLEDSGAKILLTQKRYKESIDFSGETIDLCNEEFYQQDKNNVKRINQADGLAYVIYTSGSTGKPKGVMITHKSAVNYVHWSMENYLKGERLNFPFYTSISFDLTVTSIFTPLLSGNSIIIYNEDSKNLPLERIIKEDRIGIMKLTPAHLRAIENVEVTGSGIKRLIVGGEQLETELASSIYKKFKGRVEIFNEYGPTEATVGCMIYKYNPHTDDRYAVPIGTPGSNVRIYILDKYMKLVPQNVVGELCISGDGLARGYLNRTELTAEKFIENPFESGERMYRTGDIARWLPDGNIEFLGRIDSQVKIRGYRIELSEIESRLRENKLIKDAVVLANEDESQDSYICGYVVSEKDMTMEELKSYLSKTLPEYMIPERFVQIDEVPVTANGKIDRRKLLEINKEMKSGYVFAEPENECQSELLDLWKKILNRSEISIYDNFYTLGGNSLKTILLASNIAQTFGVELPVDKLMKHPTIKELDQCISTLIKNTSLYNQSSNVVLLKKNMNTSRNLFIIHDVSGDVGGYLEICDKLDIGYNIYGITTCIDTIYPQNIDIETIASDYLRIIRSIQPEGGLNLVGWSAGGVISLEIARQVESSGELIDKIVMFDTHINQQIDEIDYKFTITTEKDFIVSLFGNQVANYSIVQSSKDLQHLWTFVAKNEAFGIEHMDLQDFYSRVFNTVYYTDKEALIKKINLIRTIAAACNRYIPKGKVNVKTFYFKADEGQHNQDMVIQNYVNDDIIVYRVKAEHYSIMTGKNAELIAGLLTEILANQN